MEGEIDSRIALALLSVLVWRRCFLMIDASISAELEVFLRYPWEFGDSIDKEVVPSLMKSRKVLYSL